MRPPCYRPRRAAVAHRWPSPGADAIGGSTRRGAGGGLGAAHAVEQIEKDGDATDAVHHGMVQLDHARCLASVQALDDDHLPQGQLGVERRRPHDLGQVEDGAQSGRGGATMRRRWRSRSNALLSTQVGRPQATGRGDFARERNRGNSSVSARTRLCRSSQAGA